MRRRPGHPEHDAPARGPVCSIGYRCVQLHSWQHPPYTGVKQSRRTEGYLTNVGSTEVSEAGSASRPARSSEALVCAELSAVRIEARSFGAASASSHPIRENK